MGCSRTGEGVNGLLKHLTLIVGDKLGLVSNGLPGRYFWKY